MPPVLEADAGAEEFPSKETQFAGKDGPALLRRPKNGRRRADGFLASSRSKLKFIGLSGRKRRASCFVEAEVPFISMGSVGS